MNIVTGVGVLDKAMLILRAVAERPRTLTEIQAETALPRATAHRLASAWCDQGMLRRDDEGRFELGTALAALAGTAAERFPLASLSRPVLERLRDETGEGVQLFVRDGERRRCVASLQSLHGLRWIVPEGAVLSMDAGSAAGVLRGQARPHGWIESVEEREPGVASVSAPVVDRLGTTVAAVCVSGPIDRLSREPGSLFGGQVVEAAAVLNAMLGTDVPSPASKEV